MVKPHLHSSLLQVLDQTFPHKEPSEKDAGKAMTRDEGEGQRRVSMGTRHPAFPITLPFGNYSCQLVQTWAGKWEIGPVEEEYCSQHFGSLSWVCWGGQDS